ncbi:MAG: carbohydrate kinase, partial [Paraburkholderia sp.]|nr:carbohydrate kinase [Paraburkholderia sp.]
MTASTEFPLFVSAGDILTDLVRTDDSRWLSVPGGAGWNVARAVARLGLRTASVGAIGKDYFSDAIWNASVVADLDMRFMQRVDRSPLLAVVHETHPPTYFFMGDNSADLAFDPALLPAGWMDQVRWAHFGCISLVRQPLGDTLAHLASDLRARGVKISYDPNYRNLMEHGYEPILRKMSALADLIKVSDEDLRLIFKTSDEASALAQLRALNPAATVLVTRGPETSTLYVGDTAFEARPPRVSVADTVGAGDASIGGLLFSLIQTPQRSLKEHLAFALASGAAACRHS